MTIWVPPGANQQPGRKGIVIVGAGERIANLVATRGIQAAFCPTTARVRYWRCGNCGHLEPQTPSLRELLYKQINALTSKTSCPNCGSYTINQLYDLSFKRGCFLVVKARNGIRGKGKQ